MNHSSTPSIRLEDAARRWAWEQPLSIKKKLLLLGVIEYGSTEGHRVDLSPKNVRAMLEQIALDPTKVWSVLTSLRDDAIIRLEGDLKHGFVVELGTPPVPLFEQLGLPANDPGFVYLVRAGFFHKIGKTKDLKQRLNALRTGSGHEMEVVSTRYVDNARGYELALHKHFAARRRNLEWFQLSKAEVRSLVLALEEV